ncbi:MAG: response regulator [Syntrophotaleaceae bacterium]
MGTRFGVDGCTYTGMDGYQATRHLRSQPDRQKMKILIVTAGGLASSEVAKQAVEAGADDYIAKPFKTTELYTKLQELCGFEYLYSPVVIERDPAGEIPPTLRQCEIYQRVSLPLLKQAVEEGDMILFSELLDAVDANNRLQRPLSALADRYEYENYSLYWGKHRKPFAVN